jgi:hypothetical protein
MIAGGRSGVFFGHVHRPAVLQGRAVSCYEKAMASGGRRLTDEEEREVRRELAELRQEHRDLDAAIAALADSPEPDTIRLQRLKKRKLFLKDRIASLDDRLFPDIIA